VLFLTLLILALRLPPDLYFQCYNSTIQTLFAICRSFILSGKRCRFKSLFWSFFYLFASRGLECSLKETCKRH